MTGARTLRKIDFARTNSEIIREFLYEEGPHTNVEIAEADIGLTLSQIKETLGLMRLEGSVTTMARGTKMYWLINE